MDPGTDLAVEKPGHRSGGRPGDSTGHRKAGDSAVTGITWAQTGHRHDLGTDLGTGDHVDHFLAIKAWGQTCHRSLWGQIGDTGSFGGGQVWGQKITVYDQTVELLCPDWLFFSDHSNLAQQNMGTVWLQLL